jgi:RHS repeat-associated protein
VTLQTSATGPRANGTSATWSYAYDGGGNRTSFSGPGPSGATVTLTTTTDDQGWPTAIEDPSTGASPDVMLAHDEAGDLVSYDAQGTASDLGFSYDAWGLTTSGTAAGTSATYVLDPLGRIASRSQGSETIAYDYAAGTEDAVRSVATGGSNPGTTSFAFAPGGPLASSKAGVTQVYLGDLHGDVVASIAPGASSLSSTAWYSAYGERTALTGTAPVLGYQGDVTDPLTGTVDMLTRNYLPMLGHFTSRDVLSGDPSDPPSLNQFVYATGSPGTFSDPTGMVCVGHSGLKCGSGITPPPPEDEDDEGVFGETPNEVAPGCCPWVEVHLPSVVVGTQEFWDGSGWNWLKLSAGAWYQGPAPDGAPTLVIEGGSLGVNIGGVIIEDDQAVRRIVDAFMSRTGSSGSLHITAVGATVQGEGYSVSVTVDTSVVSKLTGRTRTRVIYSSEGEITGGGGGRFGLTAELEVSRQGVPGGAYAAGLAYAVFRIATAASCGYPSPAAQAACRLAPA